MQSFSPRRVALYDKKYAQSPKETREPIRTEGRDASGLPDPGDPYGAFRSSRPAIDNKSLGRQHNANGKKEG